MSVAVLRIQYCHRCLWMFVKVAIQTEFILPSNSFIVLTAIFYGQTQNRRVRDLCIIESTSSAYDPRKS